ncbi:hypothetical protein NKH73_27110 [Mesorhizobium sp. M0938]|uniref:hypothetical protein n=1 Tax=unclassified Mesorhizobium TaxID=325217 RepID=UPI0033380EE1
MRLVTRRLGFLWTALYRHFSVGKVGSMAIPPFERGAIMSINPEPEYRSLTPSVVQLRWRVPTEFPACPQSVSDDALEEYSSRLAFGTVFARNTYGTSLVVERQLTIDGLVVLTHFGEEAIKDWAVAHISIHAGSFYHRSESTFLSLQGAFKHFCELVGEQLGESIDDYC